jgi:DNA-binding CsgD family transcriptional regulator
MGRVRIEDLTPLNYRTLDQIKRGLTYEQMAKEEMSTISTVKSRVRALLKKFAASNSCEMLGKAFDAGFFDVNQRQQTAVRALNATNAGLRQKNRELSMKLAILIESHTAVVTENDELRERNAALLEQTIRVGSVSWLESGQGAL